jgi:GT2 family glycosyltransferase
MSRINTPLISIVIPTFNAEKFIVKALKSVMKTNYPKFEVIIVDDQSTDKTQSLISKNFKNQIITISKNKQKLLAAGSRNRGVELAKGEYIALLDHDIEVDPKWLKEAMKIFQKYNNVGTVQSRVLDLKKRNTIQHAGIKIQSYLGWVIPIGMGDDARHTNNEEMEVFANATGLVFKKSIWKEIGGFDEFLAINTDDWDFNWRVWLYGYKQMLAPKAITYHWSKEQKTRDYWINRTIWEFNFAKVPWLFIKNYEIINVVRFLPVYILVNLLRGIFNLIFRFNPAPLGAYFLSLGWIIWHFPKLYTRRKIVQKNRKIKDSYLINNLMDSTFIHNYFLKHWLQVVKLGKNISTEKPY